MKQSPNHFLGPTWAFSTFHGSASSVPAILWPAAWVEPWERGFEAAGYRLTIGWLRLRFGVQWGRRHARLRESFNEERAINAFVQWANSSLGKSWSVSRLSKWLPSQPHLRQILALTDGQPYYVKILLAREFDAGETEVLSPRQSWDTTHESGWLDRLDRLGESLGTQSE